MSQLFNIIIKYGQIFIRVESGVRRDCRYFLHYIRIAASRAYFFGKIEDKPNRCYGVLCITIILSAKPNLL